MSESLFHTAVEVAQTFEAEVVSLRAQNKRLLEACRSVVPHLAGATDENAISVILGTLNVIEAAIAETETAEEVQP